MILYLILGPFHPYSLPAYSISTSLSFPVLSILPWFWSTFSDPMSWSTLREWNSELLVLFSCLLLECHSSMLPLLLRYIFFLWLFKKKKSYLLSVSLPIAHICLHLITYQIFVTEPSCLLLFSLTLQAHLSVAFKCSNKVFRKLCSHFIQKVCFSPSLTVTLYRSSWARFAQYRHSVECNKFSDWLERHRLSAWIFYTAVAIALQY